MPAKKKIEKNEEKNEEKIEKVEEKVEKTNKTAEKTVEKTEKTKKGPKYKLGSIVYISKDAEADLNGFKLFPPYKKYTYTVEAYDENTGVYSLRRLNLSLKLKECDVISPDEKAASPITRAQF